MRAHDVETVIEDLEFLDGSLVGATDAAQRTGFASAEAMEKWLERHERRDLWTRLARRDPAGTHDSSSRKKRRLMTVPTEPTDDLASLLAEAGGSSRTRTRNKAEKVRALVDELRVTLEAEREDDQRKDEARKEIARLERKLADAKARLRGGESSTITVGSSVSASDLRAWATRNGIECPAMGRIPAAVREAYESAEGESA